MLYYADCLMRKESIFPENISEYFPQKIFYCIRKVLFIDAQKNIRHLAKNTRHIF